MLVKQRILFLLLLVALYPGAFLYASEVDEAKLTQAIDDQVKAASDCEIVAYGIPSEKYDPEQIFSGCVETRAILIAMIKKYGIGQKGEIDVFEKMQGYSFLIQSSNELVRQEAQRFQTAAGE